MYKLLRKILLLGKKDPFILQSESNKQIFSKHNFISDVYSLRQRLLKGALLGFIPFLIYQEKK